MSDFEKKIGFSTGALEKGNYQDALKWLYTRHIQSVELSALRYDELEPLISHIDSIQVTHFNYVSFHAPSFFPRELECRVVQMLRKVADKKWNIIVHPDVISDWNLWKPFGRYLLIENMDRRKPIGRTVEELDAIFQKLPEARLCLDVAHARQLDTTLTLLSQIVAKFSNRIAEIHISELDSRCQHRPMSYAAVSDYHQFARKFKSTLPVIIESMLDHSPSNQRMEEFNSACFALRPNGSAI